MTILSLLFILALTNVLGVRAACDTTSRFVGATGALVTKAHGVAGTVRIVDDCTFEVTKFKWDGGGPAVEWYGASSASSASFKAGTMIAPVLPAERHDGSQGPILVMLPAGTTWASLASNGNKVAISVWCADFSVDFGSVELEAVSESDSLGRSDASKAACNAWAGATGELSTLAHGVSGSVTIQGDCSVLISPFSYDGQGPGAYWVVEAGGDEKTISAKSQQLNQPAKNVAFKDECYEFVLPQDITWDDLAKGGNEFTLGLYCVPFTQLFGAVTLSKPTTPTANAARATCVVAGCPARNQDCLSNCMAVDDYLNVWWELDDDVLTVELEAEVDDDTWVAFGPSPTGSMIPADVVVTGFHNGEPRALDYHLQGRSQCNYQSGANRGVCPDDAQDSCEGLADGETGANDVTLVSGERVGKVQRVRYTRKLNTGDACDVPFDGPTRVVWATGPITPNSENIVVNIHANGHKKGVEGHISSTPLLFDAASTPGVPSACLQTPSRAVAEPVKKCVAKKLIKGVTEFDATIDNYEYYPNPPSWGVAWHLNGDETPEIVVERGTKYTFNVAGTDLHPFYITDDVEGGRTKAASEKVLAGSADAHGSVDAPTAVEWTPDADTPDLVFYQCWTHIKLGWRIYVVDAGAADAFAPPADSATKCAGAASSDPAAPAGAPLDEDAAPRLVVGAAALAALAAAL